MFYKYILLKSSWGIVIFLDIEEILNPVIRESDVQVSDRIFFRISDTKKNQKQTIETWIRAGFNSLSNEIYKQIGNKCVCYDIKSLDFNYVDFQEEGLYCAIREWISKYYDIHISPIEVTFNRETNKYIFNIPEP